MNTAKIPFTIAYNLKRKYVSISGKACKESIQINPNQLLNLSQSLKEIHRKFQSPQSSSSRDVYSLCVFLKKSKRRSAPAGKSVRKGQKLGN